MGIVKSITAQQALPLLGFCRKFGFIKAILDPLHPPKTWVLSWVSKVDETLDTQTVKL